MDSTEAILATVIVAADIGDAHRPISPENQIMLQAKGRIGTARHGITMEAILVIIASPEPVKIENKKVITIAAGIWKTSNSLIQLEITLSPKQATKPSINNLEAINKTITSKRPFLMPFVK